MKKGTRITYKELSRYLEEQSQKIGYKPYAEKLGVTPQYIYEVRRRGKPMGPKLAKALRLKKVVMWEKI